MKKKTKEQLLHKCKSSETLCGSYIYWTSKIGDNYFPTTINSGESHKLSICRRIIKNVIETDLEVVFEGQNMITTDIDAKSISDTAGNIK